MPNYTPSHVPAGDAPGIDATTQRDAGQAVTKEGHVSQSELQENQESRGTWVNTGSRTLFGETESLSDILFKLAAILLFPIAASVFAAESVELAAVANDQSQTANQLALLSLCYGNLVRYHHLSYKTWHKSYHEAQSSDYCTNLIAQAEVFLPTIANKLYGLSPTSGGSALPIAQVPKNTSKVVF